MSNAPAWAKKYKTKGTAITRIGNNYYLYKVRSFWDKKRKRARRITEKYLGKITEQGIIKPRHERFIESIKDVKAREFGASSFALMISPEMVASLEKSYPEYWKEIAALAMLRFVYGCQLKHAELYYARSCLADALGGTNLSNASISRMLYYMGGDKEKNSRFMKELAGAEHTAQIQEDDLKYANTQVGMEGLIFLNRLSSFLNQKARILLKEKGIADNITEVMIVLQGIERIRISSHYKMAMSQRARNTAKQLDIKLEES